MGVDELFTWSTEGIPQPRLRRLDVPVRAVVLRVQSDVSQVLFHATAGELLPLLGTRRVWLQEARCFAFT